MGVGFDVAQSEGTIAAHAVDPGAEVVGREGPQREPLLLPDMLLDRHVGNGSIPQPTVGNTSRSQIRCFARPWVSSLYPGVRSSRMISTFLRLRDRLGGTSGVRGFRSIGLGGLRWWLLLVTECRVWVTFSGAARSGAHRFCWPPRALPSGACAGGTGFGGREPGPVSASRGSPTVETRARPHTSPGPRNPSCPSGVLCGDLRGFPTPSGTSGRLGFFLASTGRLARLPVMRISHNGETR